MVAPLLYILLYLIRIFDRKWITLHDQWLYCTEIVPKSRYSSAIVNAWCKCFGNIKWQMLRILNNMMQDMFHIIHHITADRAMWFTSHKKHELNAKGYTNRKGCRGQVLTVCWMSLKKIWKVIETYICVKNYLLILTRLLRAEGWVEIYNIIYLNFLYLTRK